MRPPLSDFLGTCVWMYRRTGDHREEFIDWRPNWDLIQFILAQILPISSSSFKSIAATAHEVRTDSE